MKCPKCGVQYKDIKTHCPCGYRYVFYGEDTQGVTDVKFVDILRRAGGNGQFYFTFPQLYTAWCQQKAEERTILLRNRLVFAGVLFLLLFISSYFLFGWIGNALSLISLVGSWFIFRKYKQHVSPDLESLKTLVKQWQVGDGKRVEMLLIRPDLHVPPPEFPEQDIYDYGVERIIIVERPLLVDLLVKNGLHADLKALIFSRDGYPAYISQRARKMLKENDFLPIFLLHDASDAGAAMVQKTRVAGRTVIDLGITQEHVKKMYFLDALQLDKKGYKAPLDILPYAVLATMIGKAIHEESTISEVLEQWSADSMSEKIFFRRSRIGERSTGKKGE